MIDTKTCTGCGRKLPLSSFSKKAKSRDGLQERCKECFSTYNRERYASDPERFRASSRKRREENPSGCLETRLRTCEKSPTPVNARRAVEAALKSGDLTNPGVCSGCGCGSDEHRIEAHHRDYTKPLDVVWLCTPCHRRMDAQRRIREGKKPYGMTKEVSE